MRDDGGSHISDAEVVMEYSQELLDFINSPDTVDFIARKSGYLLDYLKHDPNVIITQTLVDRYVLGYITRSRFESLARLLGSAFISSVSIVLGLLNREALNKSGIIQVHNQPYLGLKGSNVLVGIVDTGIDFTQPPFIYDDGTSKIQYIYDETGVGNTPPGFTVGTEYTNEQINAALKSDRPFEIVKQRDESGHGTFNASVAAGRQVGDFIGAAPEAEIIAVKLRKVRPTYRDWFCIAKDQEFAFESSAVMIGVEYIITKAQELGRPVAICIGLGSNFGGHDGNSFLEEYLAYVANLRGVCLCVAAGNESQARHHTQGKLNMAGETQNIDLKIGERASNVCISIWNAVSDRFSVSIHSPSGELIRRVPARNGPETTAELLLESSTVTVQYFFPLEHSGGQLTMVRILNATPGIWSITVHGDIVLDGTYHAWLPMTGFVAEGVEFLAPSPYYTITVPGTMLGSICCGAYDSEDDRLYLRSSWGPTLAPTMAPDLVAPGVNISGYTPSGFGTISGTSSATAVTTGACALFLQWGIVQKHDVALSTNQIRAFLIRGCSKTEGIEYPNVQWGYGKLNLMQSFSLMREI